MRNKFFAVCVLLIVSFAINVAKANPSPELISYYTDLIGNSTSYDDFQAVEQKIFSKENKLDIEDKKKISEAVVQRWNDNVDVEYGKGMAEEVFRFVCAFGLETAANLPVVPGWVGGAMDAWGQGVQDHKPASRIFQDMLVGAAVGGFVPEIFRNTGNLALRLAKSKIGKVMFSEVGKIGTTLTRSAYCKKALEVLNQTVCKFGTEVEDLFNRLESAQQLRSLLRTEVNDLKSKYAELLRKPNGKLSNDELALKNWVLEQLSVKEAVIKEQKDIIGKISHALKERDPFIEEIRNIEREVTRFANRDIDYLSRYFDGKLKDGIVGLIKNIIPDKYEYLIVDAGSDLITRVADEISSDEESVVLTGYVYIDEYRSTDGGTQGTYENDHVNKTTTNGGGGRNSSSSDTTSHHSADNGTAKKNAPDTKDTPQQQQYYEYIPETDSKVNDGGGKGNGSLNQKGPSNDGGTPFELSPQVEKIYKPNSRTDEGTNQHQNGNGHGSENGSGQNNTGINNDSTNPQKNSDGGSVPFELSPQVEKVVHPDQNNNASGNDNNTSNNNDGNSQNSEQTQNADGQTNPPQNNNGQTGGNGRNSENGVNGTGNAGTTGSSGTVNGGADGGEANNQKRPLVAGTKDDFVSIPTTISNVSDVDNLDMDPLAKQILKEYLTGESNVLPPDFIPGAFGSLSTDVKDQKTIMQEAYAGEIAKIVGNDTAEKGALTQAIEDFVNGDNGNDMKAFEDMLSQTVDPSQKDKILSLTEAFKNVDQDGGKSLIEKMGADGQAVTDSLIVNEIKKQIGDVLPKDVADEVNGLLGTLDNKNLSKDTKAKILEQVQKLVDKAVPEHSADAINSILQKVIDGTSMQTLDEAKNLGKGIAADVLKGVIDKNLDPKLAKELNALIDGYMKNGAQGLTDAAKKELESLIDQYAPGSNTAELLKDAVNGIISGQANPTTWKDVATSVVADAANKLIDESNLPPDVKKAAKEAVNGLAQNGLTGLTTNMQQFITDYVTDKLGKDAGEAAGKIFNAIVTPGVDPWQEIVNQAPVIGAAVGQKFLDEAEKLVGKQIDKLIDKCPALKLVLGKLGIDGKGIIHGVVNVIGVLVSAPNLQTAIAQLSKMGLNFLKNVAAKLIDWALEWAVSWINNNLVPKVLDWASETLGKWADSAKAGGLIQKGLEWLQQQCQNCKKCGGIKINTAGTGKKVVDWIEGKIKAKSSPGTTVLTSP